MMCCFVFPGIIKSSNFKNFVDSLFFSFFVKSILNDLDVNFLFVPYCANLLHVFFYPVQLHFGQCYFCPHGFYNTLTERCVVFLTCKVAMLRVELIN